MARAVNDFGAGRGLRLLMVNTVRAGFNGQMMFILKYLKAMDRTNMSVGFASKGEPLPEIRAQLEALGVEIHPLPLRSRHPLGYCRKLSRVVREGRYDIVHVHGNSSTIAFDLLAARLGGAKVRIAHSHNTCTTHPLVHRMLRPLLLREATARMACGADAGRWLFGEKPFEVIPIASDPALYTYDPQARRRLREEMGAAESELLLGMIGQLNPVKNPIFLLEAFAEARKKRPELKLAMIGLGPLMEETKQAAERLGLSDVTVFTGPVQDVPARMQALDMLVMPSLYEGFPNVLVEAQLAGLPALVSDRVTRDCDMTGLLTYIPLDKQAWIDALTAAKPIDRAPASEAARESIARRGFDIHAAAAALRARYEALEASGAEVK